MITYVYSVFNVCNVNQSVLRLAIEQLRGYRKFAGILVAGPDFTWIW